MVFPWLFKKNIESDGGPHAEWLALAQKQGLDLTGLTCHIKVDSGMGRIGVRKP